MSENVFLRIKHDIRKELKIISAENEVSMVDMLKKLIEEYKKSKEEK